MKNSTKLLMVLALVLGFVGCVTNGVDGVLELQESSATLVVDIAESNSRVALGDKGADGIYSTSWSEGDRLSINGYISEEAVIDPSNPSSARFQVNNAVLSYPYNVLYPASENNTVVFSRKQNYVKGTFESGSTPMYGVVAVKETSVKLNHLSGVLKFSIMGNKSDVTLEKVVINSECRSNVQPNR